jgi:hypothetical protein
MQKYIRALMCTLSLLLFAAANEASAKPCQHITYGAIGDRYRWHGGSDGPLGCPTDDEENHPEGLGRRQNFEHGQMVWMPDANNRAPAVVAAWVSGNNITVDWVITGHYNYDFFIVRWDINGQHNERDQVDVKGGPRTTRTNGEWSLGTEGGGLYRIIVKGCDEGDIFGSKCRQDWALPTYVVVGGPPAPTEQKPTISVSSSGAGGGSAFAVLGSKFSSNHDVRIRVVDDRLAERDFHQSADSSGALNAKFGVPCISGLTLHFSATDGRPNQSDLTGVLWSNTFNIACP